jgi:DNA-binding CsgD family transcriptional regulator
MTSATDQLEAARDAYARRVWPEARAAFEAAREHTALSADDLYQLGDAAWWMGAMDEATHVWEEAYRHYLHGEQPRGAAMTALSVAVNFFLRGDETVGAGWMARAQRLLADETDSAEHGYVVYLLEVEAQLGGIAPGQSAAVDALVASARRVQELGRRHHDPNLVTGGLMGEGRALVKVGRVDEGLRLLDEAMVGVLSGELGPEWAGNVYCHLMSAAHELADVHRAVAWTEATTRWLEGLPAAVLFTGICRVHRSQVHQLTGSWELAEREAARVCRDLVTIQPATAAEAHYQVGEIRRLRGDLEGAEQAYQRAHQLGRDPQPGHALLRLAQGRVDAASASIRTALLAEADDRLVRARLCAAQVEIALAAGDEATARQACEELQEVAERYASSGLEVLARHARGALLLEAGDPAAALPVLRDACRRWQGVEAPYDCARVRTLLARTYEQLGDGEAAERERDVAVEVFRRLGADADLRRARAATEHADGPPAGLTAREVEVLALVAAGRSNRQVAAQLVISEKTVARHLSNIFTKLAVTSRTEAAAFAFAHGLAPAAPSRPGPRDAG